MAVLSLDARDAAKYLAQADIKMGWVRCLSANRCSGPDRSIICFKNSRQDHRASTCIAFKSCVLCSEYGLKGE
ncbi:hypothetical protein J6590_052744 [Homalodisca vitripennis]|nr:hypothetical protein J6590_052744 [Homalodisca vitripennis]